MISQAIIPAIEASVSCYSSGTCLRLCLAVETDIDLYRCYQSFTGVPPYVAACADAFRLSPPPSSAATGAAVVVLNCIIMTFLSELLDLVKEKCGCVLVLGLAFCFCFDYVPVHVHVQYVTRQWLHLKGVL